MRWQQKHHRRWERSDGAVVKYDTFVECNTAKPWLPNHRGYIAYGPGPEETNYLGYKRKNSPFLIPCKFKTAANAMMAIEKAYPLPTPEATNE